MPPYSQTYSKGRRNSGGRGRGRKSPSWYDKKYSARTLAVKALQNVNYIRGLVNSEKFHVDTNVSATINGSTGNIVCITNIAQGDGEGARTGRSILLKDIYIRARFEKSPTPLVSRVMCVLFMDTQQVSDTNPSFSDVFASFTPETFLNTATAGRFKILSRKTYVLTNSDPTSELVLFKKMFIHLKFNGVNSTDIQKNAIYLAYVSSETGVVNPVSVSGTSRIGYHDN